MLKYTPSERIWLLNHPTFNENWLQERIAEQPSILGLGTLELLARERTQDRAGRLDLLLADPAKNRRYEVEIMFGAADPSHIMRCIEYWDIERRRYPFYDHVAVLVAEELNALKVGEQIVLDFVPVLNQTSLRRDDETRTTTRGSSREEWSAYAGDAIIGLVDQMLAMINEKAEVSQQLNYLQQYIGLTDGIRSRNFVYFTPRKKFLYLHVNQEISDDWSSRLEEAGLPASQDGTLMTVTIEPSEFSKQQSLIRDLLIAAVESYQA